MLIIISTSVFFAIAAVAHVASFMIYAFFFGLTVIFCPLEKYGAVDFCRTFLLSLFCGIPGSAFALWIAFPDVWLKKFTACVVNGGVFLIVSIVFVLVYRVLEQWWHYRCNHKDSTHSHV